MMNLLRRSLVVVVLIFGASPALAGGGPARDFTGLQSGDTFALPDGVCPFPVEITIVVNKEYTLTFNPDAAGTIRQLVNGRFVVAFTNTSIGDSVIRNVSGPGEYLYFTNGSVDFTGNGVWAIFFAPGQRGPGTPGALFVNTGKIALHTDPSGIQTVSQQIGTQEDLCAVLQ